LERPPPEWNVPTLAAQTSYEDELRRRPTDFFDNLSAHLAEIVKYCHVRGKTRFLAIHESNFAQRRHEVVSQHPDPGRAFVPGED
jgi:hypothetical protein